MRKRTTFCDYRRLDRFPADSHKGRLAFGLTLRQLILRRLWEFTEQPPEDFELILNRRSPNLNQKLVRSRTLHGDIRGALVTDRTEGAKIGRFIGSAERFIQNVTNVEAGSTTRIVGMGLARHGAAHLTGETVSVENVSTGFFRDSSLKCRFWFWVFEAILTRLQVGSVIVGEDLESFFVAQLSHSTAPLCDSASNLTKFVRIHSPSDICQKVRT